MLEANDISIEQAAIGRVCPPQWTRVSGCVVSSPTSSWVRGRTPAENGFWCILCVN